MKLLFTIEFIVIAAIWIFYTNKLTTLLHQENLSIRGVLKFFAYNMVSETTRKVIKIWIVITAIWSLTTWLFFGSFFLQDDLGFLVGLFPFVWYYFILRFFIWTKEDLMDQPADGISSESEINTVTVDNKNTEDHEE
ncbi:MAG: hypothetical protein ABUK01_14070 [Leptospirales bacterium]